MSFPEASSVHLVSKGAWVLQTNRKVVRTFVPIIFFKKQRTKKSLKTTKKKISTPSKKTIQNQSAQLEGAVKLPRTYKSFKYKFRIYKTARRNFRFSCSEDLETRKSGRPLPGPRSLRCGGGLARSHNEGATTKEPQREGRVHSGQVLTRSTHALTRLPQSLRFPQGPSCRCLWFHVPARERSVLRFPTARWRPRLHPEPHLGHGRAGPPRPGHGLSGNACMCRGFPAVPGPSFS